MNKKSWFIPILIVALNALAIIVRWSSLPELLPAHYDLQGNAGGTMPRSMLLMYILMGAVICLIAYVIGFPGRRIANIVRFPISVSPSSWNEKC